MPVHLTPADPIQRFREHIRDCTACSARADARAPVPFAFPLGAEVPPPVLVVGRNPGRSEDQIGEPFVGAAGRTLTKWLTAAGIDREFDCIVTNLVKCFTENNRPPSGDEVSTCSARYLANEIKLFKPKLVIGFGEQVSQALVHKPIGEIRGEIVQGASITSFFTYHPAAILYNAKLKLKFERDAEVLRRWWLAFKEASHA